MASWNRPTSKVTHLLRQLPGAINVEPFRNAAVRFRFGHRSRQLAIHGHASGRPAHARRQRFLSPASLPTEGLIVSAKLAEVLRAEIGDEVLVEVLEGKRQTRSLPLVGLAEDLTGVSAYMDIRALNRFLEEGDVITGASFTVDDARRTEFLRELKDIPRVSWVAIKESLRENFRDDDWPQHQPDSDHLSRLRDGGRVRGGLQQCAHIACGARA